MKHIEKELHHNQNVAETKFALENSKGAFKAIDKALVGIKVSGSLLVKCGK